MTARLILSLFCISAISSRAIAETPISPGTLMCLPGELIFSEDFDPETVSDRWGFKADFVLRDGALLRTDVSPTETKRVFLKDASFHNAMIQFDFKVSGQTTDLRLVTGSGGGYNSVTQIRSDHFQVNTPVDRDAGIVPAHLGECVRKPHPDQWQTMTVEYWNDEIVSHLSEDEFVLGRHPIIDRTRQYFAFQFDLPGASIDKVRIWKAIGQRDHWTETCKNLAVAQTDRDPVKRDPAERYKIEYTNLKSRLTLNDLGYRDLVAKHEKLQTALHADYAEAFTSHKQLSKLIAKRKQHIKETDPDFKRMESEVNRASKAEDAYVLSTRPEIARLKEDGVPRQLFSSELGQLRVQLEAAGDKQLAALVDETGRRQAALEARFPDAFESVDAAVDNRQSIRESLNDDPEFQARNRAVVDAGKAIKDYEQQAAPHLAQLAADAKAFTDSLKSSKARTLRLNKSPAEAPARPSVVFFLVDDLGWRDVGCFGSSFYDTPHVDQLATEGVRFTDAYAACHVCSPTRASILTGKYPARLGLTDWIRGRRDFPFQRLKNVKGLQQLPFEEQTLAETLKSAGYRTAAIGKWHLGAEPSGPTAHGFDVDIPQNHASGGPPTYHAPFKLDGLDGPDGEYLTDRLTDEAETFIEQNKNEPFFLYLAHFAVHDPIQGREDLVEKYQAKRSSMPQPDGEPFVLEGNPDDKQPLSQEELRSRLQRPEWSAYKVLPDRTVKIKQHQDNAEFAGMVEAMDQSLGRVLAKLKALGLDEKTIVIFFADNGGMSGANLGNPQRVIAEEQLDRAYSTSNLPLRGAKGWLYEGGIRVPMIVKWPGHGKSGTVCDVPVISTDFYPTILEMLELPSQRSQHIDGVSIASLVKGADSLDRNAIFWHFPHYSNHGMQSPGGAIRAGDYKLLEYFENNSVQLFNLSEDIGEQHDLAQSDPEKAAQLRSMLHAWRDDVSARMMDSNSEHVAAE